MFLLFLYKLFSSECLSSSLSFFTLYFLVSCFVWFIAIGIGFARLQIIWLLLILFSFFSIHQVAVLFTVQLSLRDLGCLLALDRPFKRSETGLRVPRFNFNFSSFVGVVG